MPRQIIDTESSQPAYVRRRVTTFVVIALVLVILAAAGWFWMRNHQMAPGSSPAVPGNSSH